MNILFVLPRNPWPPYVGQARLAYYRARELNRRGHNVSLFFYGISSGSLLEEQRSQLLSNAFCRIYMSSRASFLDYYLSLLFSCLRLLASSSSVLACAFTPRKVVEEFSDFIDENKFDFIHFYSIRSHPLWTMASKKEIKFLVDMIDSMTLNFSNRIQSAVGIKYLVLKREFNALRSFESNLPPMPSCVSYLAVGKADISYFKVSLPSNVGNTNQNFQYVTSPSLKLCPIGVEPFASENAKSCENHAPRIIFFGSLSYTPNIDAVNWFVTEVFADIMLKIPDIEFFVVGSRPTRTLIDICSSFESIRVIPNPPSIAPFLLTSFASVAPMVSGSGQQFKVIESLANSVPCVLTTLAAKPLGVEHDVHALVADDPITFAKSVEALHLDNCLASRIACGGRDLVSKKFSWSSGCDILEDIYSTQHFF